MGARHIPGPLNPDLKRLLTLCNMDRVWGRGDGAWLYAQDGRRFLDCYGQYGAVALGHNAPCVVETIRAALDAGLPAMVGYTQDLCQFER